MTATYDPIATTTLGSAASDVTFSSIPNTYTDLRVTVVMTNSDAGGEGSAIYYEFNGDAGSNYSTTIIRGNGSAASSIRTTNMPYCNIGSGGSSRTATPIFGTIDIFGYAGSTNKTSLSTMSGDLNGGGTVSAAIGLWRSTSAITSIKVYPSAPGDFAIGSVVTLYGIKAE